MTKYVGTTQLGFVIQRLYRQDEITYLSLSKLIQITVDKKENVKYDSSMVKFWVGLHTKVTCLGLGKDRGLG